jgi:hypothetical protein
MKRDSGYGEVPVHASRPMTLSSGTVHVRWPGVRNTEERFESRVLPLFARKGKEVAHLIPELYLHGLAEGDFDLALRGLLGEEVVVSWPGRSGQGTVWLWTSRLRCSTLFRNWNRGDGP